MHEKEWKKIEGTLWIVFKAPYPDHFYEMPCFGRISDTLIEMPVERPSEFCYRITENFLELKLKSKIEFEVKAVQKGGEYLEEENIEEENLIFINQSQIHTIHVNKIIKEK